MWLFPFRVFLQIMIITDYIGLSLQILDIPHSKYELNMLQIHRGTLHQLPSNVPVFRFMAKDP